MDLPNAVGLTFCFTGKCPLPRDKMITIATRAGAYVTKSVTNQTDILVIADPNSQSAKARKARQLGLDLISPEEFLQMCNKTKQQRKNTIKSTNKIDSIKSKKYSTNRRVEL